jgi:asparagine synthase (glutamine-hydrolysing)
VTQIGGIVFRNREQCLSPSQLSLLVGATEVSGSGNGATVNFGTVGLAAYQCPGQFAGVAETALHGYPLATAFHGSLYNLNDLLSLKAMPCDPGLALIRLYLQEGLRFLHRLRGEFALALWDGREEKLFLATDRFRVHPLYYYQDHDKLLFSSHINGMLACPWPVERTLNPEAIVDVVASSIVPTPKTIFREIKKLPPGHVLTYRHGESQLAPYWEIDFLRPNAAREKELERQLKTLLADAVATRLATDGVAARIGTFLSGGVDSSTVTGILTQLAKHPIKSFSIGFGEPRFNEIGYARIAAQAFGVEHHEYIVTPQDTYDAIPVLLQAFDEPFGNASAIPTYFCARMAREHGVDILYAGDGGDELFAGNERYATQRLFDYYHRIPKPLQESLVEPLVFSLADWFKYTPFVRGKKYIQRASIPYPERLSSYGVFKVIPMAELLDDGFLEAIGRDYDPYAVLNDYYYHAPAQTELDRQLYIDLKLAIADNDLFKVTRMTEATGITVRFPFLDHRVAEFAATVPADLKMRGRHLRSFFKKAYADLLPLETRTKEKHGFGLPIPVWLRTDQRLNEMMHDLVLSPRSVQRGYFRKKALEELVQRHKTDETSFYGTILWNLMILELWHRTYF